jgi:crotonobetainyl-CoA:carnitine CoA-transferase CaiB-like acyl-CoA transferase
LSAKTSAVAKADLMTILDAAGVPAGPINSVSEALSEPQIVARGVQIAPEGIAGLRTPITFSRSTLTHSKAAPTLGNGAWGFKPSRTINDKKP